MFRSPPDRAPSTWRRTRTDQVWEGSERVVKCAVHGQSLDAGQTKRTLVLSARLPSLSSSIRIEPSAVIALGLCAVPAAANRPLASTETVPDPATSMP